MGQRAKMSDVNHGPADSAMRPRCCGHPLDALAELRAILAETEDDNRHADPVAWARVRDERPFPVGPVGTWGWERYGYDCAFWSDESRAALAATLRALDEAPDTETWLAFVQRNPDVDLRAFVEGN